MHPDLDCEFQNPHFINGCFFHVGRGWVRLVPGQPGHLGRSRIHVRPSRGCRHQRAGPVDAECLADPGHGPGTFQRRPGNSLYEANQPAGYGLGLRPAGRLCLLELHGLAGLERKNAPFNDWPAGGGAFAHGQHLSFADFYFLGWQRRRLFVCPINAVARARTVAAGPGCVVRSGRMVGHSPPKKCLRGMTGPAALFRIWGILTLPRFSPSPPPQEERAGVRFPQTKCSRFEPLNPAFSPFGRGEGVGGSVRVRPPDFRLSTLFCAPAMLFKPR